MKCLKSRLLHVVIQLLLLISETAMCNDFSPSRSGSKSAVSAEDMQIDVGYGSGAATIANPDGSKANYKLQGLAGKARLSLLGETIAFWDLGILGSVSYLSLDNTKQINGEKEVGYFLGPGAGISLRVWRIFATYEMNYMLARHYLTGRDSNVTNYSMVVNKASIGSGFKWAGFDFLLSGSMSTGIVPKDKTLLSKDSEYSDKAIWFSIGYSP